MCRKRRVTEFSTEKFTLFAPTQMWAIYFVYSPISIVIYVSRYHRHHMKVVRRIEKFVVREIYDLSSSFCTLHFSHANKLSSLQFSLFLLILHEWGMRLRHRRFSCFLFSHTVFFPRQWFLYPCLGWRDIFDYFFISVIECKCCRRCRCECGGGGSVSRKAEAQLSSKNRCDMYQIDSRANTHSLCMSWVLWWNREMEIDDEIKTQT